MTLVAIIVIAVVVIALAAWFISKRQREQQRVREIKRREVAGHRQEAEAHESRGEEMLVAAAQKRQDAERLQQEAGELEERGERSLSHAQRHSGVAEEKERDL